MTEVKNNQPVYIIECEGEILFADSNANKAIAKSIELCIDQHAHEVGIWIADHKVGTIDLNGNIQRIFGGG